MDCLLRSLLSEQKSIWVLKFAVCTNWTDHQINISLWLQEWNNLRPTNEMQFTDRELFYTDRKCGTRSVRTIGAVIPIYPSNNKVEIFQVPLMRCNLRTKNSSIRTVSALHGPYELYGPSTLLYNPYMAFTVRTNSTDRNHSLPVRYRAGVLDNPPLVCQILWHVTR